MIRVSASTSSYDWDLLPPGYTITAPAGSEAHGIIGTPIFLSTSTAPQRYLEPASPGYRGGISIPNFSDDANGVNLSDPNMGAWDERFPVFQLGPSSNMVAVSQSFGPTNLRFVK